MNHFTHFQTFPKIPKNPKTINKSQSLKIPKTLSKGQKFQTIEAKSRNGRALFFRRLSMSHSHIFNAQPGILLL